METKETNGQAVDAPAPFMDATIWEHRAAFAIARRAVEAAIVPGTVLEIAMDIIATHLNGRPIDLDGLSGAKWGDFIHDVCGIHRYLDRTTGKLTDCFRPRYAAVSAEHIGSVE